MGSISAIEVKCPECGARLPVAGDAATATCKYCGTESRVQRRSQVFELRLSLPAAPDLPSRVAPQVRSSGGKLVAAIVGLAVVGLPLALVVGAVLHSCGVTHSLTWEDDAPVVADVDGDGVDDLIGFDRNIPKDRMMLVAVSGVDGHLLWTSPSLGTYSNVYQDKRYVAHGAIIVWDKTAHLLGFDARTGAKRWAATASEVVKAACSTAAGVELETADGRHWSVDLGSGALAGTAATCTPAAASPVDGASEVSRYGGDVPGMAVTGTYARGDGLRIALGRRSPGTAVPMLAGLAPDGAVRWTSEVPGHDALAVASGGDAKLAVSDTHVAAAYERSANNEAVELTVFDRATGRRLCEVEAKKVFQNVLNWVRFTNKSVLVSTWGSVQMFDPDTCKRRFALVGPAG